MAVTHFDFSNYMTDAKAIFKDILRYQGGGASADPLLGYYRQPTANRFRGWYWDLYGGGGNLSTFQATPALNPNGNSGDWEPNKAEIALDARTQMRALDAAFYQSTENCEEGLIGSGFDVMHTGGIGDVPGEVGNNWGCIASLFTVVYSRYQCMLNLAITLNETTFTVGGQDAFYSAWINAEFHVTGGHFCLSNGIVTGLLCPTDPPVFGQPNFRIVAYIATALAKVTATPIIKKYMQRGFRMRPLPESWEGHQLELNVGIGDYCQRGSAGVLTDYPSPFYIFSSVWLNPAADDNFPSTSNCIGIVISSSGIENLTYNIYMESEAYDLVPERVKVLYQRVGAVRTELTRFTETLDYDASIVFDGATAPLYLFEIVQL